MINYLKQFNVGSGCCYEDYAFLYGIVALLRPKKIIEIGTNYGVSAISMAKALKDFNIDGHIETFEIQSVYNDIIKKQILQAQLQSYISVYFEDIEKQIETRKNDIYDLVFIDGNHTLEYSLRDYNLLKDKSRYLIMHDINAIDGKRDAFNAVQANKFGFFNCNAGTVLKDNQLQQHYCFNGLGLIKGDIK